jgi:hypothetical protein
MKAAIAVLTYNRLPVLSTELEGIYKHGLEKKYPIAVFDDMSLKDGTGTYLKDGGTIVQDRPELMATQYSSSGSKVTAFLGNRNLGVAGNSNRAIKWFMDETDADQLCLINDDLRVMGDFVEFYGKAHVDLQVGMFGFCDFTHHASYKWIDVRKRGYIVKICPRMTGIMMSLTRQVVEAIGYFDARFGKFGEEHCDYMNRARLVGFMNLDGMMQTQLDLHHHLVNEPEKVLIKHQEVETSVVGIERQQADREASEVMKQVCLEYRYRQPYREFCLHQPRYAGGQGNQGIPVEELQPGYKLVTDFWPVPLKS